MSYIVKSGNVVATPELHENDKGTKYTYVRVACSDRIRVGSEFVDGPTTYYSVSLTGQKAVEIVELVQVSGNIKVLFSGELVTKGYKPDDSDEVRIEHTVFADEFGVSLTGQKVSVARRSHGS